MTSLPLVHNHAAVGVLTLHLQTAGCRSLKEKRSRIKPFISRLQREFNLSVAEVGLEDVWQETLIACAVVSNSRVFTRQMLQQITGWIETNYTDLTLIDEHIELI
jgi:uncharacterized protein YlxP (DUF503 family)